MCISGATGFTEYNLTCPDTFVYSHIENLCTNVTSYKCLPNYNCTAVGNFEADSNEHCTAFIACIEGIRGIAAARWVKCPTGTLFSLSKKSCVNSTLFQCPKVNVSHTLTVEVDSFQLTGNVPLGGANTLTSNHMFLVSLVLLVNEINKL